MATVTEVALALNRRHPEGAGLPAVILMTDWRRLPDPTPVIAGLPPGAMVILRHHEATNRADMARRLLEVCRRAGVLLSIAGDARLAAALGADGLHLPEHALRAGRRIVSDPRLLVTAAAHSAPALCRAARAGAEAALLSPVFATASHPDAPVLGGHRFARLVREAALPVYALGGIDARTAPRLRPTGAVGIAAIGALVAEATRAYGAGRFHGPDATSPSSLAEFDPS